ncbi:hypothetical protein JW898_01810 [Candidatus Woesearchaeota archaeon]|nr:hypothetical protein [Candidatus Woesearchaeota archaeon]
MDFLKPRDVSRMRNKGQITRQEYEVIANMQGRGLRPYIDEGKLCFRNGGAQPVAAAEIGTLVAELYDGRCGTAEDAERFCRGLVAAGYEVRRC